MPEPSHLVVRFPASEADLERLSAPLFEAGCRGIFERSSGEWEAHFGNDAAARARAQKTLAQSGIAVRAVDEKTRDWVADWKNQQEPFYLTESRTFAVVPRRGLKALPAKTTLWIEPKMTFGTGTHASTRLCAELIERHCRGVKSFLDVGTGTGILGLVAAKTGVSSVTVCDTDPLSARDAPENFRRNRCRQIRLFVGGIEALGSEARFDAASANILSSTLLVLAPRLHVLIKGPLILSGILQSEKTSFMAGLRAQGFKIAEELELEEWWACVALREGRVKY